MKTTLIALLFSLPLFASEHSTIVKVFDGTLAKCKTAQDVIDTQLGVYRAKIVSTSVTKETVKFALKLEMLKCKRSFTGYAFVAQNSFENFTISGRDGSETKASVKEVSLKGYVDGQYKLLVNEKLRKSATQLVTFSVKKSDLLGSTPADTVRVGENRVMALDIWLSKRMRLVNTANNYDDVSNVNYGAFRIRI
ncbi:MAG: hypothetical protein CME71_08005 [Halobacteriovorax sp.]|nr:hypothetical protein [Halobacteriovorax sp.]